MSHGLVARVNCPVIYSRRRRKEKKEKPTSVQYMPQGDDVVVTENELFNYDGENPSQAVNALFVGGIPETPTSPGYIPHFTTESGEGYAKIMDSTKSKDKSKERPSLETFKGRSDNADSGSGKGTSMSSKLVDKEDTVDGSGEFNEERDPDLGVENPGYDPTLFTSQDTVGQTDRKETETSPYDYIDHEKLKRDDEEFEAKGGDYLTHPKSVELPEEQETERYVDHDKLMRTGKASAASGGDSPGPAEGQDEQGEERYKRIITRDPEPPTDDDGYLRSPTRNDKFEFPKTD